MVHEIFSAAQAGIFHSPPIPGRANQSEGMNFPGAIPMLETTRLRLRPYAPTDAPAVQRLAGEKAVAATTAALPHPYPAGVAEAWIATHAGKWAEHEELIFAITLKPTGELLGSMGLVLSPAHEMAELGYWVGLPYWNHGYASEAARAVIDCGFRSLGLNRIQAHHMATNPASGRVMEKAGMTREGYSPQALKKTGQFHDLVFYGVVRSDWPGLPELPPAIPGLRDNDLH
jgi:ribosomal-protein-alanine N-acetyltransferase